MPATTSSKASISDGITLDQFLDSGGFVTAHLRPNSVLTCAALQANLRKVFGCVPLRSISPADLQAWLLTVSSKDLSPTAVKHIAKIAAATFAAAVKAAHLSANRAIGLKTPRDDEPFEPRFIRPAETRRLADAMDLRYSVFVSLGGMAGMWTGEAIGLCSGCVELVPGELEVREIVKR